MAWVWALYYATGSGSFTLVKRWRSAMDTLCRLSCVVDLASNPWKMDYRRIETALVLDLVVCCASVKIIYYGGTERAGVANCRQWQENKPQKGERAGGSSR